LMFYLILSPTQGILWFREIGWFIGFVYLLCAAMRLARFNVITNPLLRPGKKDSSKDFVGLPVPAAAATVASLVLLLLYMAEHDKTLRGWAFTMPFLMLLVAMLMVSTIRYPSGKTIDLQTRTRPSTLITALIVIGAIVFWRHVALFVACTGYIFFGLIRHVRRARVAARQRSRTNAAANSV
jgi:CDP-diacylglycerol---serine O-phosphatidyltransferase